MIFMKEKMIAILTNEGKRTRVTYLSVFALLGGVAFFMTVLNIFTHKGALTVATGVFAALCAVNLLLVAFGGKSGVWIASGLFMAELVALFTFFIISGNPDGFSCIWIAMLPACGMLLFGRKKAAILCTVMFAIMAFFFWVPAGQALLQYEYNATFRMRFPILFIVFFLLSMLLETIRAITQEELDRLREVYKHQAAHDYLTNLLNRGGLMEWRASFGELGEQAVMMIDIDHFKKVNDSYGHDVGDLVLAGVAEQIATNAGTKVSRWGGEEFVVWFSDSRDACDPEEIRRGVEGMIVQVPYCDKTVQVTVSVGVAWGTGELRELIKAADTAMFRAKDKGRNRVEYAE